MAAKHIVNIRSDFRKEYSVTLNDKTKNLFKYFKNNIFE